MELFKKILWYNLIGLNLASIIFLLYMTFEAFFVIGSIPLGITLSCFALMSISIDICLISICKHYE